MARTTSVIPNGSTYQRIWIGVSPKASPFFAMTAANAGNVASEPAVSPARRFRIPPAVAT